MAAKARSSTSSNLPTIVCGLDDNYAMCAAAMLKSLELNLKRYNTAHIYLLENNVSDANKKKIERSLNKHLTFVTWVHVNNDRVAGLKIDRHVSVATYYRLLIEELLPDLTKIVYLDCDAIINEDLGRLWDKPFEGAHLLAAPQVSPDATTAASRRGLSTYKELGIDPDCRLFNAGILLINLELWRQDEVSERVLAYLRNYHDRVLWWDQDGLNAILAEKWRPLEYQWNVMTSIFRYYDSWRDSPFSRSEYLNIITYPYIIHYNSTPKPWQDNYNLPFREIFFRYIDETAWLGWRP